MSDQDKPGKGWLVAVWATIGTAAGQTIAQQFVDETTKVTGLAGIVVDGVKLGKAYPVGALVVFGVPLAIFCRKLGTTRYKASKQKLTQEFVDKNGQAIEKYMGMCADLRALEANLEAIRSLFGRIPVMPPVQTTKDTKSVQFKDYTVKRQSWFDSAAKLRGAVQGMTGRMPPPIQVILGDRTHATMRKPSTAWNFGKGIFGDLAQFIETEPGETFELRELDLAQLEGSVSAAIVALREEVEALQLQLARD